jgi:hypothetical protein
VNRAKQIFLTAAIFLSALSLPAQTNETVKLALVAESPEASAVVDILTAQLSANDKVHLLERDQIDKVYREQGTSAENRDDLKLGRLLGADGLLILDVKVLMETNPMFGERPVETNVTARLIAVKPGVIVADEKFSVGDLVGWSTGYASHLDPFFAKLAVSPGNAIPLSVINLRSSIQSDQEAETETELKSLVIQRLSREQQFFVLERERMQQLGREKELNADESAFWNGSYLLEGTVDQNGYSPDTITINLRLTPPQGGTPLSFEVSGARTNLTEVINQLADKVVALLNIKSTAPEWSAADEASRFYDEAIWALKWKSYSEAETSADSAWALGKRDVDCATVRVKAYVYNLSANLEILQSLDSTYSSGTDVRGNPAGPPPNESLAQTEIKEELASHPGGSTYKETHPDTNTISVQYAYLDQPPDPQNIDRAIHALELYYDFSHSSPDGQPKILSRGKGWNDWHDSAWYQLGIGDLDAASRVLQNFNLASASQKAVADKLQELRALARKVAETISESPSVHDSYFVGNSIANHDRLSYVFENGNPNIFDCELNWSCFWQERPEDTLAVYRQLMSSPVFCYIHGDLWDRNVAHPPLVAWNEDDQKRIPALWSAFFDELNNSTNVLWQMEAQGLARAGATSDEMRHQAETKWWQLVRSHREELIANNVELFYLGWGFIDNPETDAMDQEYWQKTVPRGQTEDAFEKQIEYLKNFTPYDWNRFNSVFSTMDYTKEQAAGLKPLVEAYKSNLLAGASTQLQKITAQNNARWMDFYLGSEIDKILNPPPPGPLPPLPPAFSPAKATAQNPMTQKSPVVSAAPKAVPPVLMPAPKIPTNILTVKTFSRIPFEQLSNDGSGIQIFAERWSEGKLLAGLEYHNYLYEFDANGNWRSTRNMTESAIAIFDPTKAAWEFVECPELPGGNLRIRSLEDDTAQLILFQGNLYSCVDGPLQKYDFQTQQWRTLEAPGADKSALSGVNHHLYAANDEAIFEIAGNGTTRLLASTRRQPAITALDSLDNYHAIQLFAGPHDSLCASIGKEIYQWDGNDWHDILTTAATRPPEIFDEAIIFRGISSPGSDDRSQLWIWNKGSSPPELSLVDKPKPHPGTVTSPFGRPRRQYLTPHWQSLDDEFLVSSPATFYQSNLYFFVDHSDIKDINGRQTVVEKDGYHAKLVCLSPDLAEPIVIPLKFDTGKGQPPSERQAEASAPWLAMNSTFLDTTAHFSRDNLFFCQRNLDGVWSLPLSELDPAIMAQKQALLGQIARDKTATDLRQNDFMAKYDLNHNGVIDPDEKESALDDPFFIGTQLALIETNHNGILDPEELAYFDVTHGTHPTLKEEAGIEIAEHLLAEMLMKKFDASGDGVLDQSEFENLQASLQSSAEVQTTLFFQPLFLMCRNTAGVVDTSGLTDLLKLLTRSELQSAERREGIQPNIPFRMMMPGANPNWHLQPQESFKTIVEAYWQSPAMLKARRQPHP